jgi:GNAT superfamily N-acetyltransferase
LSPPIVRPLAAADRAQWDALWDGYLRFYESALDPAVTDATFARLIEPDVSNMFAFVAEEAGELLGFTHCVLHPATWTEGHYCYLEDLFVAPHARGKGVGEALIRAVYDRANQLQCARVYWHTHESNKTAQALYDRVAIKSGFIVYRR